LLNQDGERIQLKNDPYQIEVLPNGNIITILSGEIDIYDSNFTHISTIVTEQITLCSGLAISNKNIYISDNCHSRIAMTDFEFRKFNFVGKYGTKIAMFKGPSGICFKNDFLYVCDSFNRRIQIFKADLDFECSIDLGYMPWEIRASNTSLCIASQFSADIEFYDIKSHVLNYRYQHGIYRITSIDLCFCEIGLKTLYFYTPNGNLYYEIDIGRFGDGNQVDGQQVLRRFLIKHKNNLFFKTKKNEILKFNLEN
jgi:hypothetical protein